MTDAYQLRICGDCLQFHANGPDEIEAAVIADLLSPADMMAILRAPGVPDGWVVVPGRLNHYDADDLDDYEEDEEDDDGHFSWSPCDACQRPQGGDRYYAVTWRA